jgi:hypothetical protein
LDFRNEAYNFFSDLRNEAYNFFFDACIKEKLTENFFHQVGSRKKI